MRYQTHAVFCIFLSLILFNLIDINSKIWFFSVAIFFSLLPDIDESRSRLGNKIKPLSYFLKHRGVFHSAWIPLIFIIIFYGVNPELSIAAFLGYASHLVLDSFTVQGVRFAFPLKFRIRGFMKTGGMIELILFVVLVIAIILLII